MTWFQGLSESSKYISRLIHRYHGQRQGGHIRASRGDKTEKDRDGSCRAASTCHYSVEDLTITPIQQTRGQYILKLSPGMGREVVQRPQLPLPSKKTQSIQYAHLSSSHPQAPLTLPFVHPAPAHTAVEAGHNEAEAIFKSEYPVLTVAKSGGINKATDAWITPLSTPPPYMVAVPKK